MTGPIQLDSLSNHQVAPGETIYGYGSGFEGVTGVQVGAEWASYFKVDGTTVVTFTLPHGAGGATEWVILHRSDGTSSPCLGDGQLVTYASPLDAPAAPLRLDSLTPDTLTIGRADTYWLLGAGLSKVTAVVIGQHGCGYEAYDDERLVLHVPENVTLDAGSTTVGIQVMAHTGDATLTVPCHQLVDDSSAGGPPSVFSVEPTSLPSTGGQLTIYGGGFQGVQWVHVGDAEVTIESAHHDVLVVHVGSLAHSAGGRVGVEVGNDFGQNWAVGDSDHITVGP